MINDESDVDTIDGESDVESVVSDENIVDADVDEDGNVGGDDDDEAVPAEDDDGMQSEEVYRPEKEAQNCQHNKTLMKQASLKIQIFLKNNL